MHYMSLDSSHCRCVITWWSDSSVRHQSRIMKLLMLAFSHSKGSFTVSSDDVFRGCFNENLVSPETVCLAGRDYFDLASSIPTSLELLEVEGTVCFCRTDLCNSEILLQEKEGEIS